MKHAAGWTATLALAIGFLTLSGSAEALAGETVTSGSASLGAFSSYVWRGIKLSREAVLQPSVSLTYGGMGASLWANGDLETGEMNETDLTLGYTRGYGPLSIGAGYIYYGLGGLEDTQEFYLSVAAEMPLHPSLAVFYDFDTGEGAFVTAGVSHTQALGAGAALKLGATGSWCAGDGTMGLAEDGGAYHGEYNGELNAALAWKLGPVTLEPRIAWSFPLSGEASRVLESLSLDGDARVLYGGVSVSLGL